MAAIYSLVSRLTFTGRLRAGVGRVKIWTLVWGIILTKSKMINFNKAYLVLAKYTTKIESFHLLARLTNSWKILLKVM